MKRFDLYFGRDRRGDNPVSSLEFAKFRREFVDPKFPGYTVTDTVGYWHGLPEGSFVLTILESPEAAGDVAQIGREYCREFGQQAVLVAESEVQMRFVSAPAQESLELVA